MSGTFWGNDSDLTPLSEKLEALIPAEGSVPNPKKNKQLERFRKASNCYYDLFNNGLGNRNREFAAIFKVPAMQYARKGMRSLDTWGVRQVAELVEPKMREITLAGAAEQGFDTSGFVP